MKKILFFSSFFLIFSCADLGKKLYQTTPEETNKAEASEDFVQGSEDIPLIVGMEKISDGTLGFDSAAGSIVSSSYSTNLEKIKVKDFYVQTLPQMGWSIYNNSENLVKLKREKEDLEIEFAQEDNMQVVRFFYSSLTE